MENINNIMIMIAFIALACLYVIEYINDSEIKKIEKRLEELERRHHETNGNR